MSDRGIHEAAAGSNAALAAALGGPGARGQEWIPTVWFYVAVQLVEAACADYGQHLRAHEDRRSEIALRWPPASAPWKKLKELSERWRYAGVPPTASDCGLAERWTRDVAAGVQERWPLAS